MLDEMLQLLSKSYYSKCITFTPIRVRARRIQRETIRSVVLAATAARQKDFLTDPDRVNLRMKYLSQIVNLAPISVRPDVGRGRRTK